MKVKEMNDMPVNMVGDGQKPNVFFVSTTKLGVVLITRYFDIAYNAWRELSRYHHSMLEDRSYGVIAWRGFDEDGVTEVRVNDARVFYRQKKPSTLVLNWCF